MTKPPTDGVARLEEWRSAVAAMLRAEWPALGAEVVDLAATIVGMFDAGARDREVGTFLAHRTAQPPLSRPLSDLAARKLAGNLHRLARSRPSI
jgi:hypothetical protein